MNILIHKNGENVGPYSIAEVNQQIKEGSLTPSDLAWSEGWPDWVALSSVEGIETQAPQAALASPSPAGQAVGSAAALNTANPYASPQSSVAVGSIESVIGVRATKGQRFLNYIIDLTVYFIIMFVFGLVWALAVGDISDGLNLLISYGILFGYYTLLEGATGKTVGKMLTKTKVVRADNSAPGFSSAAIRALCRFIPFEQFSFLGEQARGWHDSITKTYVVKG